MSAARPFRGFPAGARMAAVPALFFSDLLAAIEDPAELYVTLHVFAALARPGARGRRVSGEMLAADPALARALARLPGGCGAALRRGLDLAVARGTLLRLTAAGAGIYTVNDAAGRRLATSVGAGRSAPDAPESLAATGAEPPSIYALYEETVGTISPLVAEQLQAAAEEYPENWILEAFQEAAAYNRRSWRYVLRILERWRDEGRTDAAVGRDPAERPSLAGRYSKLVRR